MPRIEEASQRLTVDLNEDSDFTVLTHIEKSATVVASPSATVVIGWHFSYKAFVTKGFLPIYKQFIRIIYLASVNETKL